MGKEGKIKSIGIQRDVLVLRITVHTWPKYQFAVVVKVGSNILHTFFFTLGGATQSPLIVVGCISGSRSRRGNGWRTIGAAGTTGNGLEYCREMFNLESNTEAVTGRGYRRRFAR